MRSLRFSLSLVLLFAVSLVASSDLKAQNVLVQVFTNTDCGNCKAPDNALDLYLKSHPNVMMVFVHNNFPSRIDPFYLSSKASADYQSISFYGIQADPYAYVNGTDATTDFQSWKTAIESVNSAYPAVITISATPQPKGAQLVVHMSGSSAGHSAKLRVAITESSISYDNKQSFGNPAGAPIWNNVFRTMLPSAGGDAPFVLSGSKDVTLSIDTPGTGWNLKNMRAIAYLQKDISSLPIADSASVYGLGYRDLSTLAVHSPVEGLSIGLEPAVPNPFYESTELPVTLTRSATAKLVITNAIGAQVAVVADGQLPVGRTLFHLSMSSLPAGMYEAHLFIDGVFAGTTKLVSLR